MIKMASSGINKNLSPRSAAYRAVLEGTPSLETICCFWREEGARSLDTRGDTVLHFLAIHGNVAAFTILLQECHVTDGHLKIKNVNGDTALHEAARYGRKEVAEIMTRKGKDLVFESNNLGETPLYVAAVCGKKEVFAFLETSNSDCMMRRNDGCTILHAAVIGGCYSLAISILESHPDLADKRNAKGNTALDLLVAKPESFRSVSIYTFRDLGRKAIPLQIIGAIIYSCIPKLYKESEPVNSADEPNNSAPISKLNRYHFTKFFLSHPWFKEIDDAKQKHTVAVMLARRLIRREDWSHRRCAENEDFEGNQFGISPQKNNRMSNPLIQAARLGIIEVVLEILRVCPEAAYTLDENGKNILHIVVEKKHMFLYDCLTKTIIHKDRLLSDIDREGNSVIHLAACLGYPPGTPPGVVHQMMWEVLWFKRVQYDCYPYLWQLQNSSGKTAVQVFEENHESLRKEAEKTAKEMANYVLVVSVLLGAVSFAGIFTVPGGFNGENGIPIYLKNQHWEFDLLMKYLAGGFFSSLLTMGTLLWAVFMRFETEDFFVSLPLNYVITTVAMFYSSTFTIVACCQAFVVETIVTGTYLPLLIGLVLACIMMTLVFMDTSYRAFDHMYHVIRHSLSYRGQEI